MFKSLPIAHPIDQQMVGEDWGGLHHPDFTSYGVWPAVFIPSDNVNAASSTGMLRLTKGIRGDDDWNSDNRGDIPPPPEPDVHIPQFDGRMTPVIEKLSEAVETFDEKMADFSPMVESVVQALNFSKGLQLMSGFSESIKAKKKQAEINIHDEFKDQFAEGAEVSSSAVTLNDDGTNGDLDLEIKENETQEPEGTAEVPHSSSPSQQPESEVEGSSATDKEADKNSQSDNEIQRTKVEKV
jgi:hypothetical protein